MSEMNMDRLTKFTTTIIRHFETESLLTYRNKDILLVNIAKSLFQKGRKSES